MAAKEYSLTVPMDLVKQTKGLALDIGGSVVKIVYRSKENLEEAENNTTGHLQLVYFPKSKLTEALEYIKSRAEITRNITEEHPEIFATGLGCTEFGRTISETLNIRLNNITEFDCFVKAFIHLASQLSRNDFLEPHDLKEEKNVEAEMMEGMNLLVKVQEESLTGGFEGIHLDLYNSQPLSTEEKCPSNDPLATSEDIYPCILAMCGSGIGYMQISADKSFKVLDISNRGGRALHGVGSLFTGNKNFEEFLELASLGDSKNVDTYSGELFVTDMANGFAKSDESIYSMAAEVKYQSLVYSFGKAVGAKKESFRREDLANAWLNYVVLDIVQCLTLIAQVHGIRRIFFCGSLCNSALVRSILTREMIRRNIFVSAFNPKKVGGTQFDFIKPGPHLGALGALITELEILTGEASSTTPQE